MPVPRKICHPALLYSFFFRRLIAVVVMVFSAVAMVSSFETDKDTDDLIGVDAQNTHTHTRLSASLRQVLTQLDLERKRSTAALSKQK